MLHHGEVSGRVLKAVFHVYNPLGYGFLEKVYENALIVTLRRSGIQVAQQVRIPVYFEGEEVGEYFADLLVDNSLIIEIEAAASLCEAHEAQLLNYLKATGIKVGPLLNFGRKPDFKRKVA
jgi:GxxExxY protein